MKLKTIKHIGGYVAYSYRNKGLFATARAVAFLSVAIPVVCAIRLNIRFLEWAYGKITGDSADNGSSWL